MQREGNYLDEQPEEAWKDDDPFAGSREAEDYRGAGYDDDDPDYVECDVCSEYGAVAVPDYHMTYEAGQGWVKRVTGTLYLCTDCARRAGRRVV